MLYASLSDAIFYGIYNNLQVLVDLIPLSMILIMIDLTHYFVSEIRSINH